MLQTREVACCSNPSFEATASHDMVLPAGQRIHQLLQEGCVAQDLSAATASGLLESQALQLSSALCPMCSLDSQCLALAVPAYSPASKLLKPAASGSNHRLQAAAL